MGEAIEPIPEDVLEAVRLRTKRRLAAALINALAECGETFATIDGRLEAQAGYFQSFINDLITGESSSLDDLSDTAYAMGYIISVDCVPLMKAVVEVPAMSGAPPQQEGKTE